MITKVNTNNKKEKINLDHKNGRDPPPFTPTSDINSISKYT